MNGRVMGFHQLIQNLGHSKKQVTPNTSTLQEIQNEWSCYGFSSTGLKLGHSKTRVTPNTSTLQEIQNEWPCYGFSSTGSKVRTF